MNFFKNEGTHGTYVNPSGSGDCVPNHTASFDYWLGASKIYISQQPSRVGTALLPNILPTPYRVP